MPVLATMTAAATVMKRGQAVWECWWRLSTCGDRDTAHVLVLGQVILSMQLPFAVLPLEQYVSDPQNDGLLRHCGLDEVLYGQ
ncbi:hypothetical protein [Paraburkholderia hospita]|uniref:hypothetical protein n=1 Tax=Paraburkholderia hospita TaxID=169430 RepID=UPI000DEF6B9B|nr:hypothetical protein [Paraburkholderia hospita]AXF06319.1 hypothetical protein CUJ88_49845 [Paraburkholderia hospita]